MAFLDLYEGWRAGGASPDAARSIGSGEATADELAASEFIENSDREICLRYAALPGAIPSNASSRYAKNTGALTGLMFKRR